MNVIKLIWEFFLIIFVSFFLLLSGGGVLVLILIVVWSTRAIQKFLSRRHREQYMKEKGYEKSPIVTWSSLSRELDKTDFANISSVNVHTIDEYLSNPGWTSVMDIYNNLNSRTSYGVGNLGTSNPIINILGGYFIETLMKKYEGKTRLMIVTKADGKSLFTPMLQVPRKKLLKMYEECDKRSIPVNDSQREQLSEGPKSFKLS